MNICDGIENEVFHRASAGDRKAIEEIVSKNKALVMWQAKRFKTSRLTLDEKFSEGLYGLFLAVKGYDARSGVKFSTYATRCIWANIHRANQCASLVRVPRSTVDHYKKQGRVINFKPVLMGADFDRIVTDTEAYDQEEISVMWPKVRDAMEMLSDTEQEVLRRRFFGDQTLDEIAMGLGFTKQRIHQIEVKAIEKLHKCFQGVAA